MSRTARVGAGKMVLLVALLLYGCAYGYRNIKKKPPDLRNVTHVRVEVPTGTIATKDEADQLARLLTWKLRDSGRFATVDSNATPLQKPDAVRLVAEIIDMKRVSDYDRAAPGGGIAAGRGWIQLRVYLHDGATDAVIGEFEVEGFTSAGTIFAGTTSHAMDEAATTVAEIVLGDE